MKFNFDEVISRRNTNCIKWDNSADPEMLPMWVADMDFRTAPAIVEALQKRVSHGIFGYTRVPDEYYEAVIGWLDRRHGLRVRKDWFIYTSGVVPAISAIVKAMTEPGDKVILQTPVYNCFFSSVRNNGCEIVSNPLVYADNTYHMDYEDLERKASDPRVKVLILCNPHNPAGRVWTREELVKLGDICIRHNVLVISDEIHCELVYPGHRHLPFASISEEFQKHSVTCISPSKAFNIAGLQIANIIAPDDEIRRRIDRAINVNEVCDVNPFGVIATIAAYNEGEEWLDQLIGYIWENYKFMKDFCAKNLPDFPLVVLEGTYLAWMDCSALHIPSEELEERLRKEAKLWLNAGAMYGKDGDRFMRWNLACPRERVEDGLNRFLNFVERHRG